jgi:uncharacterized protein (UPF0261 family)
VSGSGAAGAVAVLATLDSKPEEAAFLVAEIRRLGVPVLVLDVGWSGATDRGADVPTGELVTAAGMSEAAFQELDANVRAEVVQAGAGRLLGDLVATGRVAGAVGIGGGRGTWMAGGVLRRMPYSLPTVLVSTVAGVAATEIIGTSNVILIPSMTDILGLNDVLRTTLRTAATTVAALSQMPAVPPAGGTAVGMTVFGVTSAGAKHVVEAAAHRGLEVISFHANGVGGAILERLINEGAFAAVLDWTTTELADEVVGGRLSAGPDRLTAAARTGTPQVVVPGAVDVVNLGPLDELAPEHRGRTLKVHTPDTTLLRTDAEESRRIGELTGHKLLAATAAWAVCIPTKGFSALSAPGGVFADDAADEAYVEGIRSVLPPDADVTLWPFNINDPEFADAVLAKLADVMAG